MILAAQKAGLTVKAIETKAGKVRIITDDEPQVPETVRPEAW